RDGTRVGGICRSSPMSAASTRNVLSLNSMARSDGLWGWDCWRLSIILISFLSRHPKRYIYTISYIVRRSIDDHSASARKTGGAAHSRCDPSPIFAVDQGALRVRAPGAVDA